MRNKPPYDWEWFESHTPFKSILEKAVELVIVHEVQRIPTIAGCYSINHHYNITYNKKLFEDNFDIIKQMLLDTNICKHNKDVYDFVERQTKGKRSFCDIIAQGCGCYKRHSGSFEWHDSSEV